MRRAGSSERERERKRQQKMLKGGQKLCHDVKIAGFNMSRGRAKLAG
jgi:hypothetical protein